MPDMQQTLDHRTVPPFPHPMSDMYKSGKQKEIVTTQTPTDDYRIVDQYTQK